MQKYEQRKIPEQHRTQVLFGDFSILLKLNRYLRAVLQRIHQSVIVVDGNMVNHSVPELFVKLDWRCFKLGQFKEHTADGNRLGISLFTLGCEAFELFLLGAEAVGEAIVTAPVFLFAHGGDNYRPFVTERTESLIFP